MSYTLSRMATEISSMNSNFHFGTKGNSSSFLVELSLLKIQFLLELRRTRLTRF